VAHLQSHISFSVIEVELSTKLRIEGAKADFTESRLKERRTCVS
jgi:hypothetical protein